ncbi:MAG: hypothetical protein RLZZ500_2095 [Bacteroidota bacterium]|jgi:sugar phosphate isomerase/epimerase
MEIRYLCTYWGCESLSASEFLHRAVTSGYTGVEINMPNNPDFVSEFLDTLATIRATVNPNFYFIAQQVSAPRKETEMAYTKHLCDRLTYLNELRPDAINSHTGKEYYSFSSNCKIIAETDQIMQHTGIPIWHEIHRGRFTFHLKTLLDYLEVFPHLKLVGDFSHFCVVSESNLDDQYELLEQVFPHIQHIHARVGFEQSPQVNHPFAPEWANYLSQYVKWWQAIIQLHQKRKKEQMTITPEFGPTPYMPLEPFTQKPLASQWDINMEMKNYLTKQLYHEAI